MVYNFFGYRWENIEKSSYIRSESPYSVFEHPYSVSKQKPRDYPPCICNSGLLQSKWSPKDFPLTLQETRSIHDSMNIPKIEFITYIYIL